MGKRPPQRHRIVDFTAVVERGDGGKMPYRGCRHGESGFRNGTESWILLPLWKRETEERCRTGAVERVHGESGLRNGTESRVLLPLWKGETEERCHTGSMDRVHGKSGLRNGTELRILLPLWKGRRIMWPGGAGTNDFC